ncbi:acyltransferase domain-containing protein, partial [Streptomyces sp. NPDC060198]|uniref:acyltransferase domain-containing protein n=1 Tax=Streptomyces sp. NPDC060198 TaxID=3347070 RepID=UPI00364F55D9
ALKHRTIPPHINLERVNPAIDRDSSPYEIPDRVTAWPAHEGPARAGVNSFGFGGTNAHLVLEEAPERAPGHPVAAAPERGWTILPLTSRHPDALPQLAEGVRGELAGERGPAVSLADLGHTLAHRRQHLESRLSVVHSSRESLDQALAAHLRGETHPRVVRSKQLDPQDRRLVHVFTGMGPQWWGMGRGLLASEPVFRDTVAACDREIRRIAGWSLLDEMTADEDRSRMAQTWLAQPANFAVQIGLAALWRSYGVRPDAIVGHSTGEIAAFYEAGVYSLQDAVAVAVHRSRLQHTLAGAGTMLAVGLPEAEAEDRVRPFGSRISVAAVNSPASVTLAGDEDALDELAVSLRGEEVFAKFLAVEVPYHSAAMDRIKDELLASLADITPRPARVPLYLTGQDGVAEGVELDAGYWWRNVRDRVRFRAAVDRLADDGFRLFLEVGPHPVLGHAIRECLEAGGRTAVCVPSVRRAEDEDERFALSLATLHNLGVPIAWDVLHPAGDTVPLPRYPWRRDRHWTEPDSVARVRLGLLDHPLLGRRTGHTEPTWQSRLDTESLPYLSDHRIQDTVVFPAAGYLEMAAQAVRTLTGGTDVVLADIALRKALFLAEDEARTVRLSLSLENGDFTVATAPAGPDAERAVHASGVVRSAQRRSAGPALDADAIRRRSTRRLGAEECYAGLAALGYHYGPAFQAIEEVWIGTDEVLARVRPPAAIGDEASRHHIHPVLLDACFQSLLTPQILLGEASSRGTGIRLPLSLDEMSLSPVGDRPLWVHGTVSRSDGDELVGDLALYAQDGTALGRLRGFRAADVEKASAAVSRSTIDSWLAEPAWIDRPWNEVVEDGAAPTGPGAQDWLVLADCGGLGDAFAALVTARGDRCRVVRVGASQGRLPGGGFTVAPESAEQLERLFADLDRDGAPFAGTVVHLWNLDLPELAACERKGLARAAGTGAYSLVALARILAARRTGGRLHVVTRGAQPVSPGGTVEPLAAPAWGVTRVLRHQELAGHRGKLVDLDPAREPGAPGLNADAEALLREFLTDDEEEIGLRGDRRATSRLLPAEGLTHPLPLRLRADGSYLVTGAYGALGRLLCRTLVKRGARRLILMGRTPVPPRREWPATDPATAQGRAVALLRELEALGAHPAPAQVDVTDEDALTGWLDAYRRGGGAPVRGVFHLAGQVRDTLVTDMDRVTFDAVLEPKVMGAYLLDRHLRDEPLDHFVLFASIASLLTTAGQTNYAAGNAFLDALAHRRRAQGLPALSLDWGPWATGMIEELGLVDHYLHSRGMSSLSPDAGMSVLERVIGQDRAQLLVATVVDWQTFLAWYDSPPPLVCELAANAREQVSEEGDGFLDTFRRAGERERRSLVVERFTSLTGTVLRTAREEIDPAAGLGGLGLDSLLAMELRARVQADLGIALSSRPSHRCWWNPSTSPTVSATSWKPAGNCGSCANTRHCARSTTSKRP